jgi:hypothetical protein
MAKRQPRNMAEAMAALREAEMAVQSIKEAAELTEPRNRAVVVFRATYPGGRKQYSFVAIRADNGRGDDRRWFISGNTDFDDLPRVQSPMDWVSLMRWAIAGSLLVATRFEKLDNPLADSDVPVMLDPVNAPRVAVPHDELTDAYFGTGRFADGSPY